jgi:hypothetical protein
MKRNLVAALAAISFVAAPGAVFADGHGATTSVQPGTVTISCFRGPWEEVIWDRPNPVFVDSLVARGYTYPEAHAIAERVCRDPATVGDPDGQIAVMTQILVANPPR